MNNREQELTDGVAGKCSLKLDRPQAHKPHIRGYLRGSLASAVYCGVGPKAFRSWRDDPSLPDHLRRLLAPRIIRGDCYYRIANLDRFMDPINNLTDGAPG